MIEAEKLKWLLSQFDLGASTAENDPLLETATTVRVQAGGNGNDTAAGTGARTSWTNTCSD